MKKLFVLLIAILAIGFIGCGGGAGDGGTIITFKNNSSYSLDVEIRNPPPNHSTIDLSWSPSSFTLISGETKTSSNPVSDKSFYVTVDNMAVTSHASGDGKIITFTD